MIAAKDLSPAELAALLHFHADAGVDWLLEEEAVDRFAEFEKMKAARRAPSSSQAEPTPGASPSTPANRRPQQPATPTVERQAPRAPTIPDDQAVEQARFAADSARSLAELKTALEAFNGCNLKSSARSTIFASGDAASGIMIVGPMPSADDDREGAAFSGRAGQMLDRMLTSIGLERSRILLTNVIPWRPPGNRMPSPAEADICRPFIERQIMLAEPRLILLLGNFTARFFFGGTDAIHGHRGQWRDLPVTGRSIPALASLHPQELLTAPINKRLAWSDLLTFKLRSETDNTAQ